MILANLAKAIREQNYYAVVLEFLIVIAGVVIGFQISALSQNQTNRGLERSYLQRLHSDMTFSIADYSDNSAWDFERIRTQQFVLDALQSGILDEDQKQEFERGLIFVGVHNPIIRNWSTVEELYSTGHIALIQDQILRQMLSENDARYERTRQITQSAEARLAILRTQLAHYFAPIEYPTGLYDQVNVIYDFEVLAGDQEFFQLFANANMESESIVSFNHIYFLRLQDIKNRLECLLENNACENYFESLSGMMQ